MHAGLAGPGDAQAIARVDTRGDVHGDGAAADRPAVATALETRVGDPLARALAVGAGTGGRELAEGGAHDPLDLTATATRVTGGRAAAGRRPGAAAGLAGGGDLDGDGLLDAGEDLLEGELDGHEHVASLACTAPTTRAPGRGIAERGAEEGVDDVPDATEAAGSEAERVAGAPAAGGPVVAEPVVPRPLLGVGQDLVGGLDRLEPFLVTARVGVQLAGAAAVGLLDLVRRGVARHAEELVQVVGHQITRRGRSAWSRAVRRRPAPPPAPRRSPCGSDRGRQATRP